MAEKERGVGGSTLGAVQGVAMVVVAPLGLVFMEVAGEDVDEGRSPAARRELGLDNGGKRG